MHNALKLLCLSVYSVYFVYKKKAGKLPAYFR